MCINVAWIKEANHLAHVGDGIEKLMGWTAEEIQKLSLEALLTPFTMEYVKENYFRGPPGSIVPRAFPVWLLHKDGHEVCARFSAICRYGEDGELAEAWGYVQHCQSQDCLNKLLAWWPQAKKSRHLEAVAHLVEAYASM